MTEEEIRSTLAMIKRECHSMMNGILSEDMRRRGLRYDVNFGVEGVRLKELASSLPHEADLAVALFKERIRECRLLAPMLYPPEKFAPDIAEVWLDGLRTTEEAQYMSMYLLQYLPYASRAAMEWMASEDNMRQLCGFLTAGRLISSGVRFYGRERCELLDQCEAALSGSAAVSRAAWNTLSRFAAQNDWQEREVEKIFSRFSASASKEEEK